MNAKNTIIILISGGVFLFSAYKIYSKLYVYLYPSLNSVNSLSTSSSISGSVNLPSDKISYEQKEESDISKLNKQISSPSDDKTMVRVSTPSDIKRNYTFNLRYENRKAKNVKLCGSFYMWKERNMKKTDSGIWEETLFLKDPGVYKYYFVVDGKKTLDPKGKKTADGKYSYFEVK